MEEDKKVKFIEGRGITEITTISDQQKFDRYESIDYYKNIFYQCGKCGTCRTMYQEDFWSKVCPSGEFGKFEAYYLGGKNLLTWALSTNRLKWTENMSKIFYHCSLCLACTQQCQIPEIHNYSGEWLMKIREEAVRLGFGPMSEHQRYTEHVIKENNPYMEKHENRLNWIPSQVKESPNAKLAYFVGCTSSYREKDIAISTVDILNALGIEFKILKEEHCCGSPVYMTGQANEAKKIAETNVKTLLDANIEEILTSCAGCYRMLKEVYPNRFNLVYDINITHLPDFLLVKLNNGELNFRNPVNLKVTYHDPCHIGRHMGIYDSPRDVLEMIPGIDLIEMPRNRINAWCCGSGGGVRSAFKDLSIFAAKDRIKEAREISAEAIVSCCPFCLNQFKTCCDNDSFKAYDLSELVRKSI
jgi:Fe-S oxidoreductase